jgi:serine/threonine-protein kinase
VVYEALDPQLGRSVALKTLRPTRSAHELAKDSILREAEAVARLDHPAIVTLHDVGHCPSGPYLVEEMLHGETLAERMGGGPVPARDAVAVALAVAQGLAHAHGHGVVHRDLKPGNVLLTADVRVKLLDFGLAHLLGTRGLHRAGTPAYMAPEQLRGEVVDARADVFALGATLFEMLAGEPPFRVKDGRSTALDQEDRPALPEGTPRALAALVERCLSRDPARRPASGQAVVEELLVVQRRLESSGSPTRRKGLRIALAVAVACGAIVTGLVRTGPHPAAPAPPSVAVLPFADLSPGREQEYLADGVAEEILNALARVEGLHVADRTSSFSFKGKSVPLREIGRQLNVRAALEGSVRREGDRVRITAQLVSLDDGYQVWSENYSRVLTGVFDVQDDIARAVVGALQVKLAPGKGPGGGEGRTANPDSYGYYLMGLHHERQGTPEGMRRARAAHKRALALDPGNAPAQAALAIAIFNVWAFGGTTSGAELEAVRRESLAAAEKAVALAPSLVDGYAARGWIRGAFQDWAGSRADLERALELRPNDSRALAYMGEWQEVFGRAAEAIDLWRRALSLDPLWDRPLGRLCSLYLATGEFAQARSVIERWLEIAPDSPYARWRQVQLHLLEGQPAAALAAARRIAVPFARLEGTALAEHDLGHAAESDRALGELAAERGASPYLVARVHAWRGDPDRAFEWLERAVARRDPNVGRVKLDPFLRRIRGDPRYAALLAKIKLPMD